MKTNSLFNDKKDCCGCSACEQICSTKAIQMISDCEGFLFPDINEAQCSDCGLCVKICPFKDNFVFETHLKQPVVYAVKHNSKNIRWLSTSGGAFSALYDPFIENKGIVYGVAFDKMNNFNVIHRRASKKIECEEFRGSKYVQSYLGNTFKQIKEDLKKGLPVMFVGTPCQTAGLSSFLRGKKNSNLILVDIICHAVPSPLIWQEHINYLQYRYKSKIINYECRSKVYGWRGHTEKVIFENDKIIYKNKLSQNHATIFHSRLANRISCSYCKFTNTNRPSDITIADYWGIENVAPWFSDNIGVSLMILNTTKGIDYFATINKNIEFILTGFDEAFIKNHKNPSKENPQRNSFWTDYNKYGYEYVLKKYADYSFWGTIKWNIKKIVRKLFKESTRKQIKRLLLINEH